MTFSVTLQEEPAANPLDLVEQFVTANDWPFDRRSDDEMAVEVPGTMVRLQPLLRLARRYWRIALHLRLRHEGPDHQEGSRPRTCSPWSTNVFGLAISACGTKKACRCSAMPRCCAAPGGASMEQIEDLVDIAAQRMRALLSGLSVRHLGRQVGPDAMSAALLDTVGRSVTRILLVGCGKMGGACWPAGLTSALIPQDIVIVDPQEAARPPAPTLRVVPSGRSGARNSSAPTWWCWRSSRR